MEKLVGVLRIRVFEYNKKGVMNNYPSGLAKAYYTKKETPDIDKILFETHATVGCFVYHCDWSDENGKTHFMLYVIRGVPSIAQADKLSGMLKRRAISKIGFVTDSDSNEAKQVWFTALAHQRIATQEIIDAVKSFVKQ